jgi:hypothetical protein
MGGHPVAVVNLHITYARTIKVDYSRFSCRRATWEARSGFLFAQHYNFSTSSKDVSDTFTLRFFPAFW